MEYLVFLWIDGLSGESRDPRHFGDTDVLSFSWSVDGGNKAAFSSAGAGSTSVRASIHDLLISKAVDRISPTLANSCAEGKHFDGIVLSVERNVGGRGGGDYVKYVMRDVVVSRFDWDPEDKKKELVGFSFGKMDANFKKPDK
jgi:type VI secretion system Hcp family effector